MDIFADTSTITLSDVFWVMVKIAVGGFVGVFTVLFILPLIPTAIKRLSNNPIRYRKNETDLRDYPVSRFGFFTPILPGEVKIIERGNRFIRCIMRFDGHTFEGELPIKNGEEIPRNSAKYWAVTVTPKGHLDSHPIITPALIPSGRHYGIIFKILFVVFYPVRLLWWVWKRWVYGTTGYFFTGLFPFQSVRTYRIERYKKTKQEGGFVLIEDYSDHFRVADFQFPVIITTADTKDKLPVSMIVEGILQVENPYEAAYNIDDWSSRYAATVADVVTNFTRVRFLDEVLNATPKTVHNLSRAIKKIGDSKYAASKTTNTITTSGLTLSQVLISDISPAEPASPTAKLLAGVALARVDKQAQEERAKGDAAQLKEQIDVVTKGGHIGLAVLAAERNVRTAAAGGEKAVIVLGGSGDTDPIQAAMLQELKQIPKT